MKEISRSYELEFIEVAILKQYAKLGPNAQQVLIALLDRLVLGKVHGDFDKPHDWDKESSEEALDLAVYQAAKLLGLGKAEEPRKHVWGSEFRTIGPDGQQVDSNGRTPDGKPWVPPAGARVRVVARSFEDAPPYVRDVFTVSEAWSYDEDWIASYDDSDIDRHMRVVPATDTERDSRWAVSAPGRPKLQTAREYKTADGVRVSLDGRTSDGMPWVPPVGARVRIVHAWGGGTFHLHGKVGDVFVVREAYLFDEDEACFALVGVPRDGWLLRVVPA